jgi:hypothetical protein
MPPSLDAALFESPNSTVIAGRIIHELKLATTTPDETMNRYFAFIVKQVYKSCTLQTNDVIMISTSASTASCGLNLESNTGYIFSAFQEPTADDGIFRVSVAACNYNAKLPIAEGLKRTLRQFRINSANSQYLNCPKAPAPLPGPCQTGTECDPVNEYCDAVNNTCIAINAPCPTPPGTVNCFDDPCNLADPCQEAVGPVTCISNYCGGCNAIFINADRTQVCNSAS